eukprot:TRINITY_DN37390_c0_g1_i1.p1 TRINITY_DN37390_c0_g1~~TRINITY_DN37390_c0_g1_i1.p1  ORF type:complete len:176 (-),score=39.37 TRINITY_DN37390_c0_g1_i1:63-590(-)
MCIRDRSTWDNIQMELPNHIYLWLSSFGIVKKNEVQKQNEGVVELTPEASQQFRVGLKVASVIGNCVKLKAAKKPKSDKLSQVKDSASPTIRLQNWNIIREALSGLGIPISDEEKSLIISGDQQMIVELLKTIYQSELEAVSYTHLTLPTILLVQISVVAVSLKKNTTQDQTATI